MIVAGIDPSLSNTAVCSGQDRWDMHCFGSKPKGRSVKNRMARLESLVVRVHEHLKEVDPTVIFIEGYSHGSVHQAHQLGEYGGILRWHLLDITPHIYEVAPMTLKKFVTGSGKGQKLGIATEIARKFMVSFETDDAFDAFGLWRMALAAVGEIEPTNQAQRDTIHTVLGCERLEMEAAF